MPKFILSQFFWKVKKENEFLKKKMPAQKRKASQSDYKPYKKAKQGHPGDQYASPAFKKTSTYRRMVNRGFLGAAGEAKFFDVASGTLPLNTTGSVSQVDSIPTGTTVNSRDGRKFKLTSFQIRGLALADTTTTNTQGAMYLVWDRQPNKALAAITDILDTNSSVSFQKRENIQRFKIIKKWRWVFSGNSTTPNGYGTIYDIDDYVKLPDECLAETTSADTTGAIGNRVTGALLLITTGSSGASTADGNVTVTTRVNFVDV